MEKKTFKFKLLTPTLCHGADCKGDAEMRVPSIRGQMRQWHERLWGKESMQECWGFCGNDDSDPQKSKTIASKVALRIIDDDENRCASRIRILQHKGEHDFGGKSSSSGLPVGNAYTLEIMFRNFPKTEQKEQIRASIRAWLLLGTLGLRSTRAFGSVWPVDAPQTKEDLSEELETIGLKNWYVEISARPVDYNMATCTDTLSIPEYFGSIKPRHASPLKMKYIKLADGYHLLLMAKNTETVKGALKELKQRNKPLAEIDFVCLWPK